MLRPQTLVVHDTDTNTDIPSNYRNHIGKKGGHRLCQAIGLAVTDLLSPFSFGLIPFVQEDISQVFLRTAELGCHRALTVEDLDTVPVPSSCPYALEGDLRDKTRVDDPTKAN